MSAIPDQLVQWRQSLNSLDSTPCRFAHHGEEQDFPLCPATIQNTRHGCAHAMAYVLKMVILDMEREGFLTRGESSLLRRRMVSTSHTLVHEQDFRVALDPLTTQELTMIYRGQGNIIDERDAIAKALLVLIDGGATCENIA